MAAVVALFKCELLQKSDEVSKSEERTDFNTSAAFLLATGGNPLASAGGAATLTNHHVAFDRDKVPDCSL